MGARALTPAETRYANIEHELLGVVGALDKFHYFTFGRPVTILTDHKPLIAIAKKSSSECTTQVAKATFETKQL